VPTTIQTLGEVQQSWIIELVADPGRHDRVNLLYWNGTREQIQTRLMLSHKDQTVYKPARLDPSVLRAVYLPTGAADYGTTRQLFDALCSVLNRFTSQADHHIALLANAVLASWVVESTESPISVVLAGPEGSTRRQLFRLLRCLFRRALILNRASLASLCALPMDLSPSLFIEYCEPGLALHEFLRATSSREACVAAKGRLLNLACAKVFCVDDPLNHCFGDCPVLEIPTVPNAAPMPFLDYRAQREILEEFQPKLLKYRLLNLARVRDFHFDPIGLETASAEVMDCLASSVPEDAELQRSMAERMKKQEGGFSTDSGRFFRKTVLEALLTLCHGTTQNTLTVGEITRAANQLLAGAGEILTLEARAVGDILRSLRVPTERLGPQGRGIVLLKNVQRRLHTIASDYEIDLRNTAPKDCQICLEIDPNYRTQNPLDSITPKELNTNS